jgi:parallel beta-helix repeat protein
MHPRWFHLTVITFLWMTPVFAQGATYYVAKTGSHNYTCAQAQSDSTPRLTINSGITCLSAGDTLVIKSGTYVEGINDTIPAGTSTATRTTIRAKTGDTVTIRPAIGIGLSSLQAVYLTKPYTAIDGVVIDGSNVALPYRLAGSATGNLLQNSEIKSVQKAGGGNCITIQGNVINSSVINNKIHDCGDPADFLEHGIYLRNTGHLVERNEVYNITGFGIHLYNSGTPVSNNTVRYNHVHDNGGTGILIGSGSNNIAHHNIVTNNGKDGVATGYGNAADNNQVYNNTIYSNTTECIDIKSQAANAKVKNNLCLSNGNNKIFNGGTGSVLANNRLSTDLTLVVDATNTQLNPRNGSVLIDAGENIPGFSLGKFLGLAPDQGAIEFVPTAPLIIPNAPTYLQIGP